MRPAATRALAQAALVLAVASSAAPSAAAARPSEEEQARVVQVVSERVMCPSCDTTLANSDSPAADQMRVWIRSKAAAGWPEDKIVEGLVVEYGGDESILAAPPVDGSRGMLAWGVPVLVGLLALAAGVAAVMRWRRAGRGRLSSDG